MSPHNIPDHSLYSTTYQISLKTHLMFEITSYLGRNFLNRTAPSANTDSRLLHLGCGNIYYKGWVNADFYNLRFWRNPHKIWMVDLRYPLNCKSNYWDGIFSEHTLEHLLPVDARNLLRELLRTLKIGKWLRICVPDLNKYVEYYVGKLVHKEFSQWPTGAEAIRALTQNWGHRSLWDAKLLERTLLELGFVNVKQVNIKEGSDCIIIMDNEVRLWESVYLEAQKASL